ncbi:hypothetical protein QQF64_026681 [Cirrhinus molitorella]|uniref:Uncharacterized protein n=1 Tax=Cirrhinus molitorella TaxID=172907 RepID=A0ABR3NAU6_9TELE
MGREGRRRRRGVGSKRSPVGLSLICLLRRTEGLKGTGRCRTPTYTEYNWAPFSPTPQGELLLCSDYPQGAFGHNSQVRFPQRSSGWVIYGLQVGGFKAWVWVGFDVAGWCSRRVFLSAMPRGWIRDDGLRDSGILGLSAFYLLAICCRSRKDVERNSSMSADMICKQDYV